MKKVNFLVLIVCQFFCIFTYIEASNTKIIKKYYEEYKTLNISDELAKSIEFGFSTTSGTTNTLNLNGRFRTYLTFDGINNKMFKILFDTNVFLTKTNYIKNDEEYSTDIDFEQSINDKWLGYGNIRLFRNTFKNYNAVFSMNVGMGYQFIKNDKNQLTIKMGFGHNREYYTDNSKDKKFMSLNQYIEYNNKMTEKNHLYVRVAFLENIENFSDDYEVSSTFGLNFMLGENLSFAVEQEIYFDALTPKGDNIVDTKTIAKIGYRF